MRPIFATDDDRRFFVDRLGRIFVPAAVDLLAWALTVNHYHLVLRVTELPPETLFRRLNTGIGMRERQRRGDHGTVFQGRYWSRPCRQDGSVLSALSYVLGNPVHHGVVPTADALESYEWTAYPEILGRTARGLVDPEATLAVLHPDVSTARGILREAVAARVAAWRSEREGVDVCEEPGCRGARDGCLLVHAARARRRSGDGATPPQPTSERSVGIRGVHDERYDRQTRLRAAGWRPTDLVPPLCDRLGADADAVLRGGRRPPECAVRAAISFVACDGAGVSCESVAAALGVSGTAVGAARPRGRSVLEAHGWSLTQVLSWCAPGR